MKKRFAIAIAAVLAAGMSTMSPGEAACGAVCQQRCAYDVKNGVERSQAACEAKWSKRNENPAQAKQLQDAHNYKYYKKNK